LAARIVEHEHGVIVLPHKGDWPNGPSRIELAGQRIFMLETRQCGRWRVFARRAHDQHTRRSAVGRVRVCASVQDQLAILVERLEPVSRKVHYEERRRLPGATSPGNRDLSTGTAKWKIALCRVLGVAQSRRPCASIIERLIDRPIPMPLGFVVKTALNS
jgi:hypothetical protein